MPIGNMFPQFTQPGEEIAKIPNDMSLILDRMRSQALKQKELQETEKYHQGELGLRQSAEKRAQAESPFNLDLLKAKIENEKALAEMRRKGGGKGGSAGSGDEFKFHQTINDYNPNLSADQLREAADAYALGKTTLEDGTPLAPMNPTIERALNRAFKSTTTAPLITAGVKANSAEAEMSAIDKAIKEGREPYGDTFMGVSGAQLKDSFNTKSDDAQKRLGNYIASDLLAFDKAALQTRIAGTESGVTIIEEVMQKYKQTINAKYPFMSDKARQYALEKTGKVLREMLKARNEYGIGATQSVNLSGKRAENAAAVAPETTEEPSQTVKPEGQASASGKAIGNAEPLVILYKDGVEYQFPAAWYRKYHSRLKGYTA